MERGDARTARSNAQLRMWLICSFIVRDSGTSLDSDGDEILAGQLPLGQPRLSDCRDDALLDLGAGPALR